MSIATRPTPLSAGTQRLRWFGLLGLLTLAGRGIGAAPQPPGVADTPLRLDTRTPFFQLASKDLFGARGQERLDVSIRPACGSHHWAFAHAELLVGSVRYGGAFIRSAPAAGCIRCAPLIVDWYHEPTGQLSFSVNVFRQQIFVPCDPKAPESSRK